MTQERRTLRGRAVLARRTMAAAWLAVAVAGGAGLWPGQALAQATSTSTINGVTVTVIGSGSQDISTTPDGVRVVLNGLVVIAAPGTVTVDGVAYPVDPYTSLTVDGSGPDLRITADDTMVVEITEADRLQARADAGDAAAQNDLAILYFNGDGVAQDEARATTLLRAAADQGLTIAQSNLAFRLADGRGLAADPAEARLWAERASDAGNVPATRLYGIMLYDGLGGTADRPRGMALLEQAAEAGDLAALNQLGVIYGTGNGVAVDGARAAGYYRRAAEAGDMIAARNLGVLARDSGGTVVSYAEARDWLGLASAAGDETAARLLAEIEAADQAPEVPDALPDARFFYADGPTPVGPMTIEALAAAMAAGTITPDSLVWEGGTPDWIRAADLPGLAE